MTMNDADLELLRRYRNFRPPPLVDVTQRVCETIRELPPRARRASQWAMAGSAAVCAALAASLLFAAVLRPTESDSPATLIDLVIDTHEVDVQSMLP